MKKMKIKITGPVGIGKTTVSKIIAKCLLQHNLNVIVEDPEGDFIDIQENKIIKHIAGKVECHIVTQYENHDIGFT